MSVEYLCFQGEFFRSDRPFMGLNRAFKYADGCFESIRAFGERIPLLEWHFKRLSQTLAILQIETEKGFYKELESALVDTIRKNQLQDGSRLRLTVFRRGGGKYLPDDNKAAYLIEAESASPRFELNTKGFSVEITRDTIIHTNPFASLKLIGSLSYILAAKEKEKRDLDELLLLNQKGELVEATSSNLFIFGKNVVLTPPISSACLNGVMRSYIIDLLHQLGYEFQERTLSMDDLLKADEVFLSNATSGVTWVSSFRTKRYFKSLSEQLVKELNKRLIT